jgi:uncharacterized protein HemY
LAIDEKKLGSEHVDTAKCLDDLGDLCRETGQYAKAEPLYQRALKIGEKMLGSDHFSVAETLDDFAALY